MRTFKDHLLQDYSSAFVEFLIGDRAAFTVQRLRLAQDSVTAARCVLSEYVMSLT